MALFPEKDVKKQTIPLLTQVYQVDETNNDEVQTWGRRFTGFTLPEAFPDRYMDQTDGVIAAISLTRSIMDCFYETGGLTLHLIMSFSMAIHSAPYSPTIMLRGGTGDVVPLGLLRFFDDTEPLDAIILADLRELIVVMIAGMERDPFADDIEVVRNFLRKCPICNSIFVVNRSDQTYCSHRCVFRANSRRQYEKLKNASGNSS